jgi:membrane-associated phospholipid phosphatase
VGSSFGKGSALMNWFDLAIMHSVNSLANRSWIADATLVQVADNVFLVGGILMAMFWWAWMEHGKESLEKRETLACILVLIPFGVLVARVLAFSLPYRERPLHEPLLHFRLPYTANPQNLIHWSSFPSDHATVVFCVAAGLWMVSGRLGALAIGYAAAMISFPLIYTGAHFPTDILAGALLGTGIAFLSEVSSLRNAVGRALTYLDRRPAYLYCLLFIWTFEIGEMFDSVRHILFFGVKVALKYPHRQLGKVAAPLFLAGLLCVLARLMWRKHRLVT